MNLTVDIVRLKSVVDPGIGDWRILKSKNSWVSQGQFVCGCVCGTLDSRNGFGVHSALFCLRQEDF